MLRLCDCIIFETAVHVVGNQPSALLLPISISFLEVLCEYTVSVHRISSDEVRLLLGLGLNQSIMTFPRVIIMTVFLLSCVFNGKLVQNADAQLAEVSSNSQTGIESKAIRFGGIVFEHEDTSECWTPDQQKGKCILLRECPGLQHVPHRIFLRKYVCGYNGLAPLLCCPKQFQVAGETPPAPPRPTIESTVSPRPIPAGLRARKPTLFPEECGITNATFTRVVGGVDAKIGDWPWQALVLMKNNQNDQFESHCGASLISRKHVLSAAHCFILRPKKVTDRNFLRVRLAEHDLSKTDELPAGITTERSVARLVTHEGFEFGKNTNDIAIIVMDRDVAFNKFIAPVCLPYSTQAIPNNIVDKYVFITGWGRLRYLGRTANVLQQASFPIWDAKRCTDVFKEVNVSPSQISVTSSFIHASLYRNQ